tara:strand:+ start:25 stop:438 length:414 start_codon:yes stop_codon:yes gene_type:complete
MAATVYNGSGTLTHTNNSGGNQRVMVYWLSANNNTNVNNHVTSIRYGSLSLPILEGSCRVHYGLNMAHSGYSSSNSNSQYGSNHMAFHGSQGVSQPDGRQLEPPIPLEGYISNGQIFSITCSTPSNILGWNVIVVDE